MSNTIVKLDGTWQLAGFDGYGQLITDIELPGALPSFRWLAAEVPGSVYLDLARAGWIADVYADCNTLAARWVEDDYWFYRRTLTAPALQPGQRCFLVADGLDLDAVVYLNRRSLAEHHNMFRPLRVELTPHLKPGENELILRLNSGRLRTSDRRGGDYNLEVTAVATKRMHLRKPQFGARWDWAPRLMNVGICGGVRLEVCQTARLDAVVVTPELSDDCAAATLHVQGHVENLTNAPVELTLRATAQPGGAAADCRVTVAPGAGELRVALPIAKPRLWQPRGHGEQHLYTVHVELRAGTTLVDTRRLQTGVRRVEIRQDPAPDGGRLFQLVVNGQPVFCKGGNWVPADLLYPRVKPADYGELVALAVECGFNLLRIWGGGLYADPALLTECDRAGLLVWHDMIFACSKYPGDDPEFVREVDAEVRHQVRELAAHPSLAVWCGNNEIDIGIADQWIVSYDRSTRPCHDLFHRRFGEIVAAEDGSRPYWPTSPWSPDGSSPGNQAIGDQHPWLVGLGPPKGDYWFYRLDASRFPNEGGMLGPSTPATLRQILPPDERRVTSRTWRHHDNSQNTWRGESMVDNLLHVNLLERPAELAFDEYVRYGGILHGEALETAIDNWRRRMWQSAAAVFWMYNDTWPATVSWTPIDFFRRRKPAFWYVKRAFAPLRAICVELDGHVAYIVVNDMLAPQAVKLQYGLFALAGGRPVDETIAVECPANAGIVAARVPLEKWVRLGTSTHGAFAVLHAAPADGRVTATNGPLILGHQRLFRARFRDLAWSPAEVRIERTPTALRLRSETFAWAVCLDESGERPLADNWFDLLPGVEYTVPWPAEWATPTPRASNPVRP